MPSPNVLNPNTFVAPAKPSTTWTPVTNGSKQSKSVPKIQQSVTTNNSVEALLFDNEPDEFTDHTNFEPTDLDTDMDDNNKQKRKSKSSRKHKKNHKNHVKIVVSVK